MERYDELIAKVESWIAEFLAKHGDEIACRAGCSDCCHPPETLLPIEAIRLAEEVGGLPADLRSFVARRLAEASPGVGLRDTPDDRCVPLSGEAREGLGQCDGSDPPDGGGSCVLLREGLCLVYSCRPMICRTHGYPILVGEADGPLVDWCPMSFLESTPEVGEALDLELLNQLLWLVNREDGLEDGRVPFAAAVGEGLAGDGGW